MANCSARFPNTPACAARAFIVFTSQFEEGLSEKAASTRYLPTHPIALKLRPGRARSGGRRRGLLLRVRFEGGATR